MPVIHHSSTTRSADPLRHDVLASDTITADPEVKILPEQREDARMDRPWNVVIFNDPVNLMSFVSMVIQRVFGYSRDKAETMMMAVHQKGKCIVWTGLREPAELYVQQLQGWQLLASMEQTE